MESNVEEFAPGRAARELIEELGDQAPLQAALNAARHFERNDDEIAKVWLAAMKLIEQALDLELEQSVH